MKTQTIRSVSFVFLVHALSAINMLLCQKDWIADIAWFIFQIVLCVITIPVYFLFKSPQPINQWIYMLTSFVTHIVFTVFVSFVLGSIFNGWENAIIYWTEIFLSAAFGIVLLVDIFFNVKSYFPK